MKKTLYPMYFVFVLVAAVSLACNAATAGFNMPADADSVTEQFGMGIPPLDGGKPALIAGAPTAGPTTIPTGLVDTTGWTPAQIGLACISGVFTETVQYLQFCNTAAPTATLPPVVAPTQTQIVVAPTQGLPAAPATCAVMTQDMMNDLIVRANADPYTLIELLDKQCQKMDNQLGGWTFTTTDEPLYVWTGSYISDPTYGGKVEETLVDGKTGVWKQLPHTTVTWETPAGAILIGSNGGTGVSAVTSTATCVQTAEALNIINTYKSQPNLIYVKLDEVANANPMARLRSEQANIWHNVQNTQALFWVQTDQVIGDVLPLDTTEGKTLYLPTTDGRVTLTYAHSGVRLCSPLNPQHQIVWWPGYDGP